MPNLSVAMNVYNEADLLCYLEPVLNIADDIVIVEGSPIGQSVDDTAGLISTYSENYPVTLIRGVFRREEDGGYDSARMRNAMLGACGGDFILYHHADVVYGNGSLERLREAIDAFPSVDVFYSPLIEFFLDMRHLRLYPAPGRELYPMPLCGDSLVYSREAGPKFVQKPYTGLTLAKSRDQMKVLFLPDVKRYHLCFVRSFPQQVEKHFRRVTQRDWGEVGDRLLLEGFDDVFQWAIAHVEGYVNEPMFDYCGPYPEVLQGKEFSAMDRKQHFLDNMESYQARFRMYYDEGYYSSSEYKPWQPEGEGTR
ncbi:MAG: glycosyltransferase family 2 protein [Planctomycetota bacterium]|jgi:glycosyltransferase involved in cell wall biosynthesis